MKDIEKLIDEAAEHINDARIEMDTNLDWGPEYFDWKTRANIVYVIEQTLETQALALEGQIIEKGMMTYGNLDNNTGWNEALQQAADYLRAQKVGNLQDNK